jgi:general nucleoside transport system ATP-binding protein
MKIALKHIHKRFGPVHANNDISMTFAEGQIVGILGENGAGKSTLMKILAGYQPADSGEIWIDDRKVRYDGPQAAIGQGIGMLQQDPLDIGAFTILENFVYGTQGGLLPDWKQGAAQLADYSGRFGFELPPDMPVEHLSIAQRQQLDIVRLLALGVHALILDEQTTGISAEQKETLFEALRRLSHNEGMVVLLVSHKLEDVINLCDSVVVLRNGLNVGEMLMPDVFTADVGVVATTKARLVELMFGQEMPPQSRSTVGIDAPVMVLENLHVRDARLSIENVQLEIHAGEVIGLAGLDGSGQELFMRALCGLAPVHSGHVRVQGADLTNQVYRKHLRSGVVFGAAGRLEEGLVAGLTLTEHMALARTRSAVIQWPEVQAYTQQQIAHYDVRGQATDQIEQLSGGNQQRVLMALLPPEARLLILEQPTRGLDVDSARWIWQQLLERREQGCAIVFSSPELDELVAYSDRILVFYAGRLYEVPDVEATTIDELGHLIGGEFE